MSWLLRKGDVLAAIDPPARGWPHAIQGAVVRRGPFLVHTLRAGRGLDLAWCAEVRTDDDGTCLEVSRIASVGPWRVARPHLAKGAVVAAERGAFDRWQLRVGDELEIREV